MEYAGDVMGTENDSLWQNSEICKSHWTTILQVQEQR